MIFVDSSAIHAYLDSSDARHDEAADSLAGWLRSGRDLVSHNYVIVEAVALAQRWLGAGAAAELMRDLVPLFRIVWVDRDLHDRVTASFLAAQNRRISLVDWTCFIVMRDEGIDTAFAFDADFEAQGFRTVPG